MRRDLILEERGKILKCGKCREREKAMQTQPLVSKPRREAARMVGRGHSVWKVPKSGRGRWMHSPALVDRIMEQAVGNWECVGSDDFLETFPHHTQGPMERGSYGSPPSVKDSLGNVPQS